MMQQTSIMAYLNICEGLGKRQKQALEALITVEPANNQMLAYHLNKPINTITPRIKELRDKGLVVCSHIGECPFTKRQTIYWKVQR